MSVVVKVKVNVEVGAVVWYQSHIEQTRDKETRVTHGATMRRIYPSNGNGKCIWSVFKIFVESVVSWERGARYMHDAVVGESTLKLGS